MIYSKTGIEDAENDLLVRLRPAAVVRRLADLFTGRDPAGGNVELTIDPAVQQAAMRGLEGATGAVVALDPSTGAILALASTPDVRPEPAVQPRPGRDPRLPRVAQPTTS